MTEDVKETVETPPENQDPPEADPVEEVAKSLGWNPDYEGDNPVDAKTFILNSKEINRSVSKKLKNVSRELEAMREGITAMRSHYETSHKREVERLTNEITALKKERDAAVEEGDTARYKLTNEKIEQLEGEKQKVSTPPPPPNNQGQDPVYVKWIEDGNEWYEEDPEMQVWANGIAQTPEFKVMPKPLLLKKLTQKAKELFPEKFTESKAAATPPEGQEKKPAAVGSPGIKAKKTRKATADDLNYNQRRAGEDFIAAGVFKNLDEYAQSLADSRKE